MSPHETSRDSNAVYRTQTYVWENGTRAGFIEFRGGQLEIYDGQLALAQDYIAFNVTRDNINEHYGTDHRLPGNE